jgi:predicted nucleic acid-binding protein
LIAYVDSSVLLRVVLGEPDQLDEWSDIEHGVTSALAEVETLRTFDRLRLGATVGDQGLALRREAMFRLLEGLEIIEITRAVLGRAAQPLPTALGTLDAIHLASALLWNEQAGAPTMATHDGALAVAARACGLPVVGVRPRSGASR